MNQYERIVAYIHQYQDGVKGANVGYAKIEKRGENCRIQVQMRSGFVSKNPQIYLFRQLDGTIRAVPMGEMNINGNEIYYKGSTEVGQLFGSELSLEEADGILIYLNRGLYFATSWKNDNINLGEWRQGAQEKMPDETKLGGGKEEEHTSPVETQNDDRSVNERQEQDSNVVSDREDIEQNHLTAASEDGKNEKEKEQHFIAEQECRTETGEIQKAEVAQIQMQAICGVCPFKRQNMDYGKRILLSFPTMRPFPEEKALECVRLELQDIGCLPMKYWSLSGNRFLLHGYYCYRHLIFCRREQGKYLLGVPGVYSDREQKNACRFGFADFQSIGGFGKQQGAFGYWLMELM